jgi:hypothetical protein
MAFDQKITFYDYDNKLLTMIPVLLNEAKEIYLLHSFDESHGNQKKYIRSELILVKGHILTNNFCNTVQFIEELNLFDAGNDQNQFFRPAEHHRMKNLELKLDIQDKVYISKAEAKTIWRMFHMALSTYSPATVLENEYIFTPQSLTKLLHVNNFFLKR